MADVTLDLYEPVTFEREDEATLAAIDKGVLAADEGQTVPIEEVRAMIPQRISELNSRSRR